MSASGISGGRHKACNPPGPSTRTRCRQAANVTRITAAPTGQGTTPRHAKPSPAGSTAAATSLAMDRQGSGRTNGTETAPGKSEANTATSVITVATAAPL